MKKLLAIIIVLTVCACAFAIITTNTIAYTNQYGEITCNTNIVHGVIEIVTNNITGEITTNIIEIVKIAEKTK